ncbi:PAAR-like domain-containing protein [Neisseria bergeri]|uniref:PAAR-like domain-containing protein n=1 Tax=Neisseria bergeri TaxID=1906581 RepID=UPI00272A7AF7|nr:PAAR-like domain-containing protein [Neisseria bergeri]
MAFNKIARKDSDFYVICTLPDFCWAPPPAPPVTPPIPFPLFADLGNAQTVAKDVRLNRKPAFVFKASKTNRTTGDEPALPGRKGVLSRTATKPAWPMMHSSSVKIRKRHIIRAGDMFHMNNKFKKKLPPKPCISCKAAAGAGRPVNPIHGLKFLESETDFAFEGILPLVWSRSYYSDQDGIGWLGEGWSVPGCQRIIRDAAGLAYIDDQGRLFPLPEVDEDDEEPVLFESEQIWFSKNPDGHYVIASLDGSIALRFAPLVVAEDGSDEDSTLFPLVAVEDANGNHQRFVYHPLTGLLQYVIDGNGRVFSLNFGNVADEQSPKMRLLSVSLLEGLPVFGETVRVGSPLVRYEYNGSGDLVRVIGRDGNVKRSFGYKNNLMVSHTDAAGLVSEYEYDHYTPTGKVLRNWTSLGEEWRFTYHDGYTEVTDVLGRTEQYHYDYNNELTKRVFADGSTVLMERDGLGRLLSHTNAMGRVTRYQYSNEGQVEAIVRPDGAILHFDYDDCYRLIRKSDAEGRYDGYTYDEAGNLLTHTDPLKHTTRFEYAGNGLLLSVTDPNGSSTAYHYNKNHQPDLITDCSGYETKLSYTPEGQLARITDALGRHTEYHYDADQNLTLALYPDGSKETFGYDAAGRLTTHTDGEGHTTSYEYGQDGLPTRRTNALGHTFGYHYDKARRLIGLTNENGARYRFAYDVLDRLIAESGFDRKLTGYRYNAGNELVEQREYGDDATLAAKLMAQPGGQPVPRKDAAPLSDGLDSQTPLRMTEFKRDVLGRLIHTLARNNDKVQETVYQYDLDGNLVRAANRHSITCFDYNGNGQIIAQHQWKVPTKEENAQNGLPETDWRDAQYDMLYLPVTESIRYHYDFNGNRTAAVLPDGRQINCLYYGSGHLHQISLGDEVVSDIERDKLHREIFRTQGKLAGRYELDPLGRLKRQIAAPNELTQTGTAKNAVTSAYAVKRSYGYDRTGNLTRSTDQRTGTTHFEYDRLGRITQAGNERFAFDPAHNILSDNNSPAVQDNRLKEYNGTTYYYDHFGNLIHRELTDGEVQNYFYDLHDQLRPLQNSPKSPKFPPRHLGDFSWAPSSGKPPKP